MIEKETEKANVKEMKQRENELKEKKNNMKERRMSKGKIKNLIKDKKEKNVEER